MLHHAITASTGTLTLYYPAGMQPHAITASTGKLTLPLPHFLDKPNDRHKGEPNLFHFLEIGALKPFLDKNLFPFV